MDRQVSGAVAGLPAVAAATSSGQPRTVMKMDPVATAGSLFEGAMSPGTFLSNSATYSGKTFATLGVTPGTYVWTWGNGANQNFTLQIPVPPPPPLTGPPVAITNPATLIASFAANLNGSVNPHGLTTSVYFQYGTTNGYGLTTAPQSRSGNTFLNISAQY